MWHMTDLPQSSIDDQLATLAAAISVAILALLSQSMFHFSLCQKACMLLPDYGRNLGRRVRARQNRERQFMSTALWKSATVREKTVQCQSCKADGPTSSVGHVNM